MAKVGRPLKYERAEDMEKLFIKYMKECEESERPYTITGLANSIEMERGDLLNYANRDEFSNTIKKYKSIVLQQLEERLVSGKSNVAGLIFNLKNNYGWADKQEIEYTNNSKTLSLEDIADKKKLVFEELKKEFTIEAKPL